MLLHVGAIRTFQYINIYTNIFVCFKLNRSCQKLTLRTFINKFQIQESKIKHFYFISIAYGTLYIGIRGSQNTHKKYIFPFIYILTTSSSSEDSPESESESEESSDSEVPEMLELDVLVSSSSVSKSGSSVG